MRNRTRAALAGVAVLTAAAPALADTVNVSTSTSVGSYQLAVYDMAGNPFTSAALVAGQPQPFQVRVTASGFRGLTTANTFSVSAKMNNLYKVAATGYDYGSSIPSSDLSIDYQTNPLRAFNPVGSLLGSVTLNGSLPTCSSVGSATGLVGGVLSDIINADPVGGLTTATDLCTQLSSTAHTVSNLGPIALPSAINLDLSSLLPADLPFNLGSTLGTDYQKGAFLNADYSPSTVGAGASSIPSSWATDVTSIKLLTGKAGLTPTLTGALTAAITSALASNPLSSVTGSGADLPVASVIAALNGATDTANNSLSTLAGTLGLIPAADAVKLVNSLVPSAVTPTLDKLTGVGQTSVSYPELVYSGATTAPTGSYKGTMTITILGQ